MIPSLAPRQLSALQRVLLVALFVPGMLLMTASTLPALMVLPFFPGGTERAIKLLNVHKAYATAVFTGSASDGRAQVPDGSSRTAPKCRVTQVRGSRRGGRGTDGQRACGRSSPRPAGKN